MLINFLYPPKFSIQNLVPRPIPPPPSHIFGMVTFISLNEDIMLDI